MRTVARHRPFLIVLALAAVSVGAVGGCSSDAPGPYGSRITVPRSSASLDRALVTESDLAASGVVSDAEIVPGERISLYQDTGPLGPCGAAMAPAGNRVGALEGIAGPDLEGWEVAYRLTPTAAATLVAAVRRDMRPGCPPVYRTYRGTPLQTTTFMRSVPIGGADGASWLAQATVLGEGLHAAFALLRRQGTVVMLVLFTEDLFDLGAVQRLDRLAAQRLDAAVPG